MPFTVCIRIVYNCYEPLICYGPISSNRQRFTGKPSVQEDITLCAVTETRTVNNDPSSTRYKSADSRTCRSHYSRRKHSESPLLPTGRGPMFLRTRSNAIRHPYSPIIHRKLFFPAQFSVYQTQLPRSTTTKDRSRALFHTIPQPRLGISYISQIDSDRGLRL